MTVAWYGHLKFKDQALWKVILVSWLIALPEYMFQVPANRFGHLRFSAIELKTMQEFITLVVFIGFNALYLRESLKWNHLLGFSLLIAAVYVTFREW